MSTSELEQKFEQLWTTYYPDIDLYSEYPFSKIIKRRHRFDFCHPDSMIAIELQGGIHSEGRHTNGADLIKEYEKMNIAAQLGWRVFYLCTNTVEDEAIYHQIAKAIASTVFES